MIEETVKPYLTLRNQIKKIDDTIRQIECAIKLPETRAREAQVLIVTRSAYSGEMSEAQKLIGERMKSEAVAHERREGEIARDRELRRLATVLDVQRADLPALAEAARFGLLDIVLQARTSRAVTE